MPLDLPTLHVEGKDDLFTIAELLQRHGVDMSPANRPLQILIAKDPVTNAEGVAPLLASMSDAIRNATDRPIGFVLDVDIDLADRWSAVCSQLCLAGLTPPSTCPVDGYFGQLANYPFQVGVWLMPDCVSDHGKLEHLLKTLVPAGDPLWPHAESSTDQATALGALFGAAARDKALIHCWLAWQSEPGVPYGTAINAKFFGHNSPEARSFLRWLKALFNLSGLQGV